MKNCLIFGLGASGESALNILNNNRRLIYLYDDDESVREATYQRFKDSKNIFVIKSVDELTLGDVDLIVISPAISINDDRLALAQKMNIEIISELELGFRYCHSKIIAVTGTNGKPLQLDLSQIC